MLPVDEDGEPDFEFLEKYVETKRNYLINEYTEYAKQKIQSITYKEIESIENKDWESFPFVKVFKIKGGFYNKKPPQTVDKAPSCEGAFLVS